MAEEAGQVRATDELDAEALARRQVALAQIRQYPDPSLRLRAREVEHFDAALASLVERMASLMRDANGAGLAGPQVGVLQRVFVFQPDEDGEPVALVNPRIVDHGSETKVEDEGCLSLQQVYVPVERDVRVVVEAQDLAGEPVELELVELPARVAQHELDHLDGVLILDRTTLAARRDALGTLRAQLSVA